MKKVVLALSVLLFGVGWLHGATTLNRIQQENRQPGTTAWQLTNPADNHRQIEGYASLTSVPVGGNISLFVNTADATYSLTVYRMGWYSGQGGRKVMGPQSLAGVRQVTPTTDPTQGILECHWTNPFIIHVPTSWVSGIYLVKLHGNTSGKESYITFTVRDSRQAAIVFQQSVITYQAYNPWPGLDPVTQVNVGQSLYQFQTKDDAQAKGVSFDRPYMQDVGTSLPYPKLYGIGAGDFLYNVGPVAMEYSMVRWLEHEGYDVTYITDVDTHEDVSRLLRGKGFLSVGHDEYWSAEMKSHVVQARDQGVSLGFFGANYMYWPVQLLPDSNQSPNRTILLAPKANRCQLPDKTLTQTFCASDADCATGDTCLIKAAFFSRTVDANNVSETEQAIVGGMDDPGVLLPDIRYGADMVVNRLAPVDHWVYTNTGLQVGDDIPGLIGIEYNSTLLPEDFDPPVAHPIYPIPNGLVTLMHTQAPNFGNAPSGGGFDLPPNFDGKDFNGWYEAAMAFADSNGGAIDIEQKFCATKTSTACTTAADCGTACANDATHLCSADADCGTGVQCIPTEACLFPCHKDPISPLFLSPLPDGYCSNPFPYYAGQREDWAMTVYQASSGAWVFNAATNQWSWGLDDYFTGIKTGDGANNGPALRTQCGYPFFHPGLVSCRNPALEQITRNVLNRFIGH